MKQSTHFYEAFACRDNGEEFFTKRTKICINLTGGEYK